jgi:CRP-like cAMP-binding protein
MHETAVGNCLLSELSSDEISLLLPLQPIDLRQDEYVVHSGYSVDNVIFPQSGVISLIVGTGDGNAVEVAMIGREGIVGSAAVAGTGVAVNNARVQVSGRGYSVPRARFLEALGQSRSLRDHTARFDCVLLAQAQQAAACNASHSAQARVCRWLLELRDRCESDVVPLTQGLLAHMVGVQRTTVTLVASKLQTAGIIRCRRGKVRILDPAKLQHAACECYGRMKKLRESLLVPLSETAVQPAPASFAPSYAAGVGPYSVAAAE